MTHPFPTRRSSELIRVLVGEISEAERHKFEERTALVNKAREALRQRTFALQIGLILLLALSAALIARSQWEQRKAHWRARDLAARQETIFEDRKSTRLNSSH